MAKLTAIQHLQACAEAARNFINGLVSQLATTTAEAIEEIETIKADKTASASMSIPADGWTTDDTVSAYPYYYDFAVDGVTALDRAIITISPNSQETAISCGICPTNETLAGTIRIRSKQSPAESISAEYWIEQGKES